MKTRVSLRYFVSYCGLTCQAALKKTKKELDLSTDIEMLLMLQNGIRGEKCHSIYPYANANDKYMKDYYQKKESSYIQYGDVNNIYDWTM